MIMKDNINKDIDFNELRHAVNSYNIAKNSYEETSKQYEAYEQNRLNKKFAVTVSRDLEQFKESLSIACSIRHSNYFPVKIPKEDGSFAFACFYPNGDISTVPNSMSAEPKYLCKNGEWNFNDDKELQFLAKEIVENWNNSFFEKLFNNIVELLHTTSHNLEVSESEMTKAMEDHEKENEEDDIER